MAPRVQVRANINSLSLGETRRATAVSLIFCLFDIGILTVREHESLSNRATGQCASERRVWTDPASDQDQKEAARIGPGDPMLVDCWFKFNRDSVTVDVTYDITDNDDLRSNCANCASCSLNRTISCFSFTSTFDPEL